MSTEAIQAVVAKVHTLPALSPAVLNTLRVLDNPGSTPRDVARSLLGDQVITGQLLRLANSAYYGAGRRITTVSDATTLLGFQTIRSLLMSVAMRPILSHDVPGYELHHGALWQHSIAVAVCSQQVAIRCAYRPPEEAFVAGLMHDIGKLALGWALADRFSRVTERSETGIVDFLQAEREEFGIAHDDAGAMVARVWGLPLLLAEVLSHHHRWDPELEHARLTGIVHVADAVCLMLGIGLGSDGLNYQLDERVLHFLELTAEDVENFMEKMVSRPLSELWKTPILQSPSSGVPVPRNGQAGQRVLSGPARH